MPEHTLYVPAHALNECVVSLKRCPPPCLLRNRSSALYNPEQYCNYSNDQKNVDQS